MRRRRIIALLVAGISATALTGRSSSSTPAPATSGTQALVGTFPLTAGSDPGGTASGTYFQMVEPGGKVAGGPFFDSANSTSTDRAYTLLAPGADGGLTTGSYQPNPDPAFDASGNAVADAIAQPTTFAGIKCGLSTNATDPQTGASAPAPAVSVMDGELIGQVEVWTASWNKL